MDKIKKQNKCLSKGICKIYKNLKLLTKQEQESEKINLEMLKNIQLSISTIECSGKTQNDMETYFPSLAKNGQSNIIKRTEISDGTTSFLQTNPMQVENGLSVYVAVSYYDNVNPEVFPIIEITDNKGNVFSPSTISRTGVEELGAIIATQFWGATSVIGGDDYQISLNSNKALSYVNINATAISGAYFTSESNNYNGKNSNISITNTTNTQQGMILASFVSFGNLNPELPMSVILKSSPNPISSVLIYKNTRGDRLKVQCSNKISSPGTPGNWVATVLNLNIDDILQFVTNVIKTYTIEETMTPKDVNVLPGTLDIYITCTGGGGAATCWIGDCVGSSGGGGGGAGSIVSYQVKDITKKITIQKIGRGGYLENNMILDGGDTIIDVDGIQLIGYGGKSPGAAGKSFGGDSQIGNFITFGGLECKNGDVGPDSYGGGGGGLPPQNINGPYCTGGDSSGQKGSNFPNQINAGASALGAGASGKPGSGSSLFTEIIRNGASGIVKILFVVLV